MVNGIEYYVPVGVAKGGNNRNRGHRVDSAMLSILQFMVPNIKNEAIVYFLINGPAYVHMYLCYESYMNACDH